MICQRQRSLSVQALLRPLSAPKFSLSAEAAPARRANLKYITGLHLGLADVAQLFDRSVNPQYPVNTDLTSEAASHTEGAM